MNTIYHVGCIFFSTKSSPVGIFVLWSCIEKESYISESTIEHNRKFTSPLASTIII